MDWQPIETAPKDGSYVLVWPPSRPGMVSVASWNMLYEYWLRTDANDIDVCLKIPPTHWALIPPGPESKASKNPAYGCYCNAEEKPTNCVLDEGRPRDCIFAWDLHNEGKIKEYCNFWCKIEKKNE